jgi:nucleotide-binding universal stress UspA family protein
MFTRILVPIDFSACSDAALAYALRLAASFGSTLHLLHVAEATFLRAMVTDPADKDTAVLNRLDALLTDADRKRFSPVSAVEHSDLPADQIVRYAGLRNIDLIVMGTHGHTGLAHVLLGSVAEKVVRHAPCPVVTLRTLPAAMTDGHTGLSRVLATTDFSPQSDRALEYARAIAARSGAPLHLLHVLEDTVDTAAFGTEVFVPDSPEVREARVREAMTRLAQRGDSAEPHATTEVVGGAAAKTIATYAAQHAVDLIVMGTHGRTGIAHLVMGSVAEQVVRTAACPVLSTRYPSTPQGG